MSTRPDSQSDLGVVLGPTECGRVCAVATGNQRELRKWSARYGALFSDGRFDSALLGALAHMAAFSAPWLPAAQLRIHTRMCLWGYGVDEVIETARTPASVRAVVHRCVAVAEGAAPSADDPLTRSLADIRDHLADAPSFPELRPLWTDQVRRSMNAMSREWEWHATLETTGEAPVSTVEEYLLNADSVLCSVVVHSHWIATSEPGLLEHIDVLRAADEQAQRALRLVNDLATYHRERAANRGDFNVLMIDGVTRDEVNRRLAAHVGRCEQLLRPLIAKRVRPAVYLDRLVKFATGMYSVTS